MAEGREVIISWSFTNWFTVFLMATLGALVAGFGWRFASGAIGKKNANN